MFSFYPSHSRPLRYSSPAYSVYPDDDLRSRYVHSRPPVSSPAVRYRRALSEYLAAEEEYDVLLRARRESQLRGNAEAVRRERTRLRLAQLARARKEQLARQFEQGLAKALARAAVSEDDDPSLHHVVPVAVMYRTYEEPLSDMVVSPCPCAGDASVEKEKVCGVWILFAFGPDHGSDTARCGGDE